MAMNTSRMSHWSVRRSQPRMHVSLAVAICAQLWCGFQRPVVNFGWVLISRAAVDVTCRKYNVVDAIITVDNVNNHVTYWYIVTAGENAYNHFSHFIDNISNKWTPTIHLQVSSFSLFYTSIYAYIYKYKFMV